MTDVYLCWWPGHEDTIREFPAIVRPVMSDFELYRSPDHIAELAAEEACKEGGELLGDTVCVQLKGSGVVRTFTLERVDTPQFRAEEVV